MSEKRGGREGALMLYKNGCIKMVVVEVIVCDVDARGSER